MIGRDPVTYAVMQADAREKERRAQEERDRQQSDVSMALARSLASKRGADEPGMDGLGDMAGMGMKQLGGLFGGGGGGMGGSGFGGLGFGGSPWDLAITGGIMANGAIQGNDPTSPLVHHGRQKTDKEWMVNAGAPIGGAIGSIFGFGGAGALAGQNAGATLADLTSGNINNLGLDVSANLPPIPGMQQPGWKGLVNGATGLPLGTLFGKLFG